MSIHGESVRFDGDIEDRGTEEFSIVLLYGEKRSLCDDGDKGFERRGSLDRCDFAN